MPRICYRYTERCYKRRNKYLRDTATHSTQVVSTVSRPRPSLLGWKVRLSPRTRPQSGLHLWLWECETAWESETQDGVQVRNGERLLETDLCLWVEESQPD